LLKVVAKPILAVRHWLKNRPTFKEELRKAGWGLTGIGVTGTLVNGKPLVFLILLGVFIWVVGLIDIEERLDNDE
jgi:hypothetical protein